MNDAADEPPKPTSPEPEFREISDETLQRILADHKKWLEAGDIGLNDLRADLTLADLRGRDLRKAELQRAYLREAQLQGADLDSAQLQAAEFHRAQLQEAHLYDAQLQGAQLQGANLDRAQLQGANVGYAQLQEASFWDAQLQRAWLGGAQLQRAWLGRAQLQGAHLPNAQLQGAGLIWANLRGADLTGANLDRLVVSEDGEPGQERSADLTDADFRDADLSNAQLSTVTGLRAEMLAGTVLTNAKLPEDIKKFDKLTHVAETSRNASTVFFGLLAASLYSWLTIATTTDVALITGTASSPLPIINTNIALSGFYLAAPLILIAVYFYFHLYLQRLWGDLASLPAVFPDGEALDGKAYPWLLNGLVRAHFKKLELAQRPLTRVENVVSILLAWWVVPFTLLAFWIRFLPRHDWWVTTLHVLLITLAAWFGVYSYRLAVRTLRGANGTEGRGDQPLLVRMRRTVRDLTRAFAAASPALAIVLVFSIDAKVRPGADVLTALLSGYGYKTYADLTDEDISTKPSGWTGREETAAVEIAQVKGADLQYRDLRQADARRAFLVRAKLAGADLRGADLRDADLRGADLWDDDLFEAQRLDELSSLWGIGFVPRVGRLSRWLRAQYYAGADLRGANLGDADLRGADLRGGNLRGANFRDANLTDAQLSAADLRGGDIPSPAGLGEVTQEQLDVACGNDDTMLDPGLTIRTCPVTASPTSPSPPPGSS